MTDPLEPSTPQQLPPPASGMPPQPGTYSPQAAPPSSGISEQPAAIPPAAQTGQAVAAATPGIDSRGRARGTRVSAVWVGLIAAAVFLVLLIIFIAQNLTRVSIHFLGFNGHLSLGLTILIAAIIGLLIAAVPGSIRILQLRRVVKRARPPSPGSPVSRR